MNRKIRLIWTFRGPDASQTAKHHAIHLEEFARNGNYPYIEVGTKDENDYLSMAFIIINESELVVFKDTLKPDRGTIME